MEELGGLNASSSESFANFFLGKRVLVTGDTGFKGSWLSLWLHALGAEVTGFALPPPTEPSLFQQAGLASLIRHIEGDIRDLGILQDAVANSCPQVVFHMAAQALVREAYVHPVETLSTNVLGTANLLEAVRCQAQPCAVVVVTSDKCYENKEWVHGYRETDPMGGHDLYSASKACAELVTSAYRCSFFSSGSRSTSPIALASARGGNVVGPGDWARDRIVPDSVVALQQGRAIRVRNPLAIRPWQHVLEALSGYLWLVARLTEAPPQHASAWNFGPEAASFRPVRDLVDLLVETWGAGSWEDASTDDAPHEAHVLRLSIDKATAKLGWRPVWGFEETVRRTGLGYRALASAAGVEGARTILRNEIAAYTEAATRLGVRWAVRV